MRRYQPSDLIFLVPFYIDHNITNKQVKVRVKLFNFSRIKRKTGFAEASDGQITGNQAMIISGFLVAFSSLA